MNLNRLSLVLRILAVAAALSGIVTVYRRWLHVNPTTVALTFLILVLLLAAEWGLQYAVFAAAAATLCFNYYFLPPVGTFTVADPQNWIALLAFLVTAVVGSRLSDRIRQEAARSLARQHEVEQLFRLSRELLQTDRVTAVLRLIPQAIADLLLASGVVLYLLETGAEYVSGTPDREGLGRVELRELASLPEIEVGSVSSGVPRRAILPLRIGMRPRGVLLLIDTQLSRATLEALGGLISISIDRADALERATRSEASKESERLRTAMLDSITHELRTPLTAIKASASTLLEQPAISDDARRDLLEVIDEESDRLDHLVTEAVEMAQLDSREVRMQFVPCSLRATLDAVLARGNQPWEAHRISVQIPPDLPFVTADPVWIEKVLSNLLSNAAKYSPPASEILISGRSRTAGGMPWVDLDVADHGRGIEDFEQQLIFKKFYRSPSVHVSGTGMGLAVAKAILEEHGGSIEVVSQPGRGSVFTVSLHAAS